jgi:Flp pilus assembly protein TadB
MHATIRRSVGVDTEWTDELSRKASETPRSAAAEARGLERPKRRLRMTNCLRWRKMTWALVLWSGCIVTWIVLTGSDPVIVALWWLAGIIGLCALWLATQPPYQQGRGLSGLFVRPGWGQWRVVDLHRTHRATEPGPNAG